MLQFREGRKNIGEYHRNNSMLKKGRRAKMQFSNISILLGYSRKLENEMRGYHETIGSNYC